MESTDVSSGNTPQASGPTAPGAAYREAPAGGQTPAPRQEAGPAAPTAESGPDPLADFRPALEVGGLHRQMEQALGTRNDAELASALTLVEELANTHVDLTAWEHFQRRQILSDPQLVRVAHGIAKQMAGYVTTINTLQRENAMLKAQLSLPGQQKVMELGGQSVVTSEEALDLEEESIYAKYFGAKSEIERNVARKELEQFQRNRYSSPQYRRGR